MIKAILIDVDNTLLDFNESSREAACIAARELGVRLPDDFFPVFKDINDKLWLRIEDGSLTKEGLHEKRWSTIFDALGIDFDGILFEECFRKNMAFCAATVPGASELVAYLYERYPLYIASNASAKLQLQRLKLAGLDTFFSGRFLSEEIGAAKPSALFWQYCISATGFSGNELVMIGDSPSADIIGAHDAGISTIWYNHDDMPVRDVPADRIVYSLSEISKLL